MSDYLRCPECKGRCCRDHYGYRIAHMDTDAEFCEHTCDACYDGSKYTAPLTAEEERADVIAYLAQAARSPQPKLPMNQYMDTLRELIECGAHVGFSKKEKP